MKCIQDHIMLAVLLAIAVLVPTQAFAQPVQTPEPVSLSLLAIGLGGLGAAELIRRRKGK